MRLLVTTFRLPTDLCTGDKTTIHHMLKYLSSRHEIFFMSFAASEEMAQQTELVAPYCKRVEIVCLPRWRSFSNCVKGLLSADPLQVHYFRSRQMRQRIARLIEEEQIDLAYGYHLRSAQYLADINACPRVLDLKPVQTLNLKRMKDHVSSPIQRLLFKTEFRRVRRYEPEVVRQMDLCCVISERDRREIDPDGQQDNVFVNPHGLDVAYFAPDAQCEKEPASLIFTGNMNYVPNVDAITYFCEQIFPIIKQRCPSVQLKIVGKDPRPAVVALASDPSIQVTGFVDDMRTYTNKAQIAVAPIRIAAGLQNKVLEAMAMGLPLVMTPAANEGIGAAAGQNAVVADSADEFAQQVVDLLNDPLRRINLGEAARDFIEREWSWESHFEDLEQRMLRLVEERRNGKRLHGTSSQSLFAEPKNLAGDPQIVSENIE